MELKTGYKQTEVGVIPEEWSLVQFDSIFDFRNGANGDKSAYGVGLPFINVLEVITYSHISAKDIIGRVNLPKKVIDSFLVRPGDLVFNRTSETQEEVGLSAVYIDQDKVVFGGFVIRGRLKTNETDALYLGYALRSPAIRSQITAKGQGAIRANIGQSDLRQVYAPLPPLPEQRAIAAALSDMDELISAQDELIIKKRNIKQATMQQLLTGKKRLPGFSGEWETKRLGDVTDMNSGGTPSSSVSSYYDGDIPWVSIADMTKSGKYISATERNLTTKGLANSSAKLFPAGTILYAMYASIGECSIATVELCSSQAILGIRPRDRIDSHYLYFYLASKKEEIKSLGQQGTQSNLNAGMVKNFSLSLPKKEEQTAIAAVLSDMDDELRVLEMQRDKTRALKQGMMQELLTGRIRLV